eukprot:m.197712 g.197712  ORF g.197712 m.197712 type:complete len:822 (-) comp17668_c0_seq8:3136-5601(-)
MTSTHKTTAHSYRKQQRRNNRVAAETTTPQTSPPSTSHQTQSRHAATLSLSCSHQRQVILELLEQLVLGREVLDVRLQAVDLAGGLLQVDLHLLGLVPRFLQQPLRVLLGLVDLVLLRLQLADAVLQCLADLAQVLHGVVLVGVRGDDGADLARAQVLQLLLGRSQVLLQLVALGDKGLLALHVALQAGVLNLQLVNAQAQILLAPLALPQPPLQLLHARRVAAAVLPVVPAIVAADTDRLARLAAAAAAAAADNLGADGLERLAGAAARLADAGQAVRRVAALQRGHDVVVADRLVLHTANRLGQEGKPPRDLRGRRNLRQRERQPAHALVGPKPPAMVPERQLQAGAVGHRHVLGQIEDEALLEDRVGRGVRGLGLLLGVLGVAAVAAEVQLDVRVGHAARARQVDAVALVDGDVDDAVGLVVRRRRLVPQIQPQEARGRLGRRVQRIAGVRPERCRVVLGLLQAAAGGQVGRQIFVVGDGKRGAAVLVGEELVPAAHAALDDAVDREGHAAGALVGLDAVVVPDGQLQALAVAGRQHNRELERLVKDGAVGVLDHPRLLLAVARVPPFLAHVQLDVRLLAAQLVALDNRDVQNAGCRPRRLVPERQLQRSRDVLAADDVDRRHRVERGDGVAAAQAEARARAVGLGCRGGRRVDVVVCLCLVHLDILDVQLDLAALRRRRAGLGRGDTGGRLGHRLAGHLFLLRLVFGAAFLRGCGSLRRLGLQLGSGDAGHQLAVDLVLLVLRIDLARLLFKLHVAGARLLAGEEAVPAAHHAGVVDLQHGEGHAAVALVGLEARVVPQRQLHALRVVRLGRQWHHK